MKLVAYVMNSSFSSRKDSGLPFNAVGISGAMIVCMMAVIASIRALNLSPSSTSPPCFLLCAMLKSTKIRPAT